MNFYQDKDAEKKFFDEIAAKEEIYDKFSENDYDFFLKKSGFFSQKNKYVLEAGCATGAFGSYLSKMGITVHGVDISSEMIRINKKVNAGLKNYSCQVGDIEKINIFKENSFDSIFCFFVLHHFPRLDNVLKNFSYWIRPGGTIYIIEPNGGNIVNKFSKLIRKFIKFLFPNLLDKLKLSTENEKKDYSVKELIELFGKYNFVCELKSSYLTMKLPKKRFLFLPTIKYILYVIVNHLPFVSSLNKGDCLILRMKFMNKNF